MGDLAGGRDPHARPRALHPVRRPAKAEGRIGQRGWHRGRKGEDNTGRSPPSRPEDALGNYLWRNEGNEGYERRRAGTGDRGRAPLPRRAPLPVTGGGRVKGVDSLSVNGAAALPLDADHAPKPGGSGRGTCPRWRRGLPRALRAGKTVMGAGRGAAKPQSRTGPMSAPPALPFSRWFASGARCHAPLSLPF